MGSNNYTASGDRAGLGNSQATQRHESLRLFISPVPLTVRLRKKYYRLVYLIMSSNVNKIQNYCIDNPQLTTHNPQL